MLPVGNVNERILMRQVVLESCGLNLGPQAQFLGLQGMETIQVLVSEQFESIPKGVQRRPL